MGVVRQILRNTVTGWTAIALRTAIALVMVPFLLNHLGKEGYGIIGLIGVLVSLASVTDLGLRSALGRELSEQVARQDYRAFNELASTAFALYVGMAIVQALAAWMLAPWITSVFKVAESLRHDTVLLIRSYGVVLILLSFITPVFSASLSSYNRFDVVNSVQIIGGIASSLLLFLVIPRVGNALFGWAAVMLLFQAATFVLMVSGYRTYCRETRLGFGHLKPERLRPLFRLGGAMYTIQLTQAMSERSDPLVISYFWGPAGVALYQPGGKLSQIIRPLVFLLAEQMHPLTTRQHVLNQGDNMRKILVLGTKYTLLMGSLFSACMIVFCEPFARVWLESAIGHDYRIAAQVMLGWALVDLTTYAAGTQWPVLLGMKKLRFVVWTLVPTAVLNILVSIYLVGFTDIGIAGVLVATIIIGLIRRPILIRYTAKVCGLTTGHYLWHSYFFPFVCLALTLIAALSLDRAIQPDSYTALAACAAGTSAAWALSCWFIGLNGTERSHVRTGLEKGIRKVFPS